jgi:hypothetical protein
MLIKIKKILIKKSKSLSPTLDTMIKIEYFNGHFDGQKEFKKKKFFFSFKKKIYFK